MRMLLTVLFCVSAACAAYGQNVKRVGDGGSPMYLVEDVTGTVVNVIVVNPDLPYTPPAGYSLKAKPEGESASVKLRGPRKSTWDGQKVVTTPEDSSAKERIRAAIVAAERAKTDETARLKDIEAENANLKARIEALESKAALGR